MGQGREAAGRTAGRGAAVGRDVWHRGGLAKRRFARFLTAGQRARSGVPLATMIRLYRMGFEAEPWDYYVGINLIASLRLRGQRFSATGDDDLAEARSLLPVVRLMVRRLPPQMRTFWPTVTRAELVLHEYLLDHPDGGPAEPVISAYSEALAHEHPPDYEKAAYDQLDIFRRAGDPPDHCCRPGGIPELRAQ